MSLCRHTGFLVLPPFRAPGCPLAAEERVQRRAGQDACKLSCDFNRHVKKPTESILCTKEISPGKFICIAPFNKAMLN